MNCLGNMQNLIANTLLVYSLVSVLFNNSIVILLVLLDGSLKIYFLRISEKLKWWLNKNMFYLISNLKIISSQVMVVC